MKRIWIISFLLSILGAAGGYFIAIETFTTSALPIPDRDVFTVVLTVQAAVLTLLFSWIGLILQKRTDLTLIKKEKKQKGLLLSLWFGVLTGFLIQAGDAWVFPQIIPGLADHSPTPSFAGLAGGVLYGGIVEEVMLRLFGMTLFIYLVGKIRRQRSVPDSYYWAAIILTSILFAVAHLPANAALFGELSLPVVFRALLLNSIGGLFFGYLYWKYGFWFSVWSHMTAHISMQLIFIPIFF
ncbi:CPBP family intramembrane metalloprotease [Halobacillus sp. ACCC02827]|uniref:CPBP family intramembrane glutamic endopeptidase n=1 Tax=Halobacillus sp. ACCC02827 TaxID=3052090 RepID=UPI00257114B9|nr:CPBP family intramembrane glutamic endopeptidase [Halobacillus sp. ACCC02827]WJE15128.1 CPBP family intramembrane metalloprotease [Halobacillus sp. ACCC02827]